MSEDRTRLVEFVEAIGAASNVIKRDECGDPRILGRLGHIYAVPGIPWDGMSGMEGFQIYCRCAPEFREASKLAWTWAKKRLSFCRVTQDGDEEGILFLGRLPTLAEGEEIRAVVGIRKKPEASEGQLRVQKNFGQRGGVLPSRSKGGE